MNEQDYGVDWQEYSLMATNNVNDTLKKKYIYPVHINLTNPN